ncbi:NADH-quinone oxidoreductase subunit NuoG [Candidatus Nitrospira bockiana]
MATIYIDRRPYDVDAKQNLLAVCLSRGLNLPYFCWHPAMGSVGACRQCAVKQFRDEQDRQGRLVMACMTPASEGTRISIDDPEATAFRESVVEWLMANHPHDCPVCDEGGECHLQDMTVMTGHAYRRYRFPKRTFRNQYLGPFIKHDMNRCIECYRCVRFYRDYAGGRDFDVFASHNHVYFGRHEEGVLENEFSGNLIEICPTGVFNDNTLFHHYTRKWDLQSAQSICVHCGIGCNTTPGERYGVLRRIVNRYNSRINGYFLCDRGRFGYDFVNSPDRITRTAVREDRSGPARPVSPREALERAAASLGGRLIGIGSPRASLEANFALRKLVGAGAFCTGLSAREQALASAILDVLKTGPTPVAAVQEVEEADAVLVLGEDVLNTAPRLALALLQAIRQQPMGLVDALGIPRWHDAAVRGATHDRKGPLFIIGHRRTWLHDFATEHAALTPADTARLGFAVAHAIDANAPAVAPLEATLQSLAGRIAEALSAARRPVVIAGMGSGDEGVIHAAANVAWALHRSNSAAKVCYAVPDCNTIGVAVMGGVTLEAAYEQLESGERAVLIVLERDLSRELGTETAERVLGRARQVIVLDGVETPTTRRADVLLPAATFAEGDGTFINYEGRAQRFYQVFVPGGDVQEGWRWLHDLASMRGEPPGWKNLDDVIRTLATEMPMFGGVTHVAPPSDVRFAGRKVPRQPERYSGRTAMFADVSVHEPKPAEDPDSPLAFSVEGYRGRLPSPLIPQFWAPGWNSNQALNKFQREVGGPLREEVPGVRLIQPADGSRDYFTDIPPAFAPRPREWLLLPFHHLFGSEELSGRAPAIRARVPRPSVAVHPDDARRLGLDAGRDAIITIGARTYRLPVALSPGIPKGAAGVPVLDGWPRSLLPTWAHLTVGGAG